MKERKNDIRKKNNKTCTLNRASRNSLYVLHSNNYTFVNNFLLPQFFVEVLTSSTLAVPQHNLLSFHSQQMRVCLEDCPNRAGNVGYQLHVTIRCVNINYVWMSVRKLENWNDLCQCEGNVNGKRCFLLLIFSTGNVYAQTGIFISPGAHLVPQNGMNEIILAKMISTLSRRKLFYMRCF